jgi:hypothetical protein
MTDTAAVVVNFGIDDSKITILTRATRLRGLAVDYLTSLRSTAVGAELTEDIARLDEILAWLNEMET